MASPNLTFSSTVFHGSSSACWNTMPRSWPQPAMARSPTVTAPELAASSPMMMRSAVVLPQPLGPARATTSPCSTSNDTPSSARAVRVWPLTLRPNVFDTFWIWT
jgi:hypothetical protein